MTTRQSILASSGFLVGVFTQMEGRVEKSKNWGIESKNKKPKAKTYDETKKEIIQPQSSPL
jgi:hypothetical protein